jgi:hypothetical protein
MEVQNVIHRFPSLGGWNKQSILEAYPFELEGLATIVRLLNSWTNVTDTLTLKTGVISHKTDKNCSLFIHTENISICKSQSISI